MIKHEFTSRIVKKFLRIALEGLPQTGCKQIRAGLLLGINRQAQRRENQPKNQSGNDEPKDEGQGNTAKDKNGYANNRSYEAGDEIERQSFQFAGETKTGMVILDSQTPPGRKKGDQE